MGSLADGGAAPYAGTGQPRPDSIPFSSSISSFASGSVGRRGGPAERPHSVHHALTGRMPPDRALTFALQGPITAAARSSISWASSYRLASSSSQTFRSNCG